jgi:hypothetical protein
MDWSVDVLVEPVLNGRDRSLTAASFVMMDVETWPLPPSWRAETAEELPSWAQ